MAEAERTPVPAISRRIRETREHLQDQWKSAHPGEPNPFTQEEVARRVGSRGVTLSTYGKWERGEVEPRPYRVRQIAVALRLEENYFEGSADIEEATRSLNSETDRLHGLGDQLQELVVALRTLVEGQGPPPPRGGHD